MKHICAWCQKELSPSDGIKSPPPPFDKGGIKEEITHGICKDCADVVLADVKAVKVCSSRFTIDQEKQGLR